MVAVATIRRAIDALLAAQAADGSFRDFTLGIGASGPWVTAHVGGRLAGLPPRYRDDRVARAAARALRFLDGATWSYNEHAPADADTIAHALILAGGGGGRRARPGGGAGRPRRAPRAPSSRAGPARTPT
jgi:hypothetical protein